MAYVYILESVKNGRFYIGSTLNLKERLREHNLGMSPYTRNSRPFKLVFSQEFPSAKIARKTEYKLKKLKSRKIIERIIEDQKIRMDI